MVASIIFELLDPDRHDRERFSSGVEAVDNFLQKTAAKLVRGRSAKVFVAINPDADPSAILEFYSINAHSVSVSGLPNRYKRFALPDGNIPAAFIGMIGVHRQFQGQGIGGALLVQALRGAHNASQSVGTAVVILDVLDCGDRLATERRQGLYAGYGFKSLSDQPLRMYLPIETINKLI